MAYQKILQLMYIDKFLNDIQLEFRNKYKDVLEVGSLYGGSFDFNSDYQRILFETEQEVKKEAQKGR